MNRYEALRQAVEAHAGQKDKCGHDYILHPIAVADACEGFETLYVETLVVLALLHDVREDTDFHVAGLSVDLEAGLEAITRRLNEPYFNYINRVCGNYHASIVKLADLWHNLSPVRQSCLPAQEQVSLEKRYQKARDRIWEALGFEWWPEPVDPRSWP